MLVRVFRVTDKFSNAALKLSVWLSNGFLDQVVYLRTSIETLVVGLWTSMSGTASTLSKSSQNVYQRAQKAVEVTEQKRREVMAQRATTGTTNYSGGAVGPAEMVIEDPMITQNRTLSLFSVLLMVALIGIVLWSTNREGPTSTPSIGGALPQNSPNPTEGGPSLPTPQPTRTDIPPTFASWRGTLAFTVRESGQEDIFALQRNDAQPRRLTNDPADDRDPAWSPDGTTIAFVSNRNGSWDLYTLNVQTQALARITTSTHFVGAPTWSPDGVFIAYEGYDPVSGNIDIYIIAADRSSGPYQITFNEGPDIEPAWSPSNPDGTGGRLIAYTSIRDRQQDIYLINLDNPNDEDAINLTSTTDEIENFPAWSPDGRQVVYSSRIAGVETVFFRNIDDLETPAVAVGNGRMPVWNPVDGSSIFYAQQRRQNEWLISGAIPFSFGSNSSTLSINGVLSDLDWTPNEPVFQGVVANYPPIPPVTNIQPDADGLYNLAALPGVNNGDAYLNPRAAIPFNALRNRATDVIGIDFLSQLGSAFWALDRSPDIGQPRENWHYTGRAFSLPDANDLITQSDPAPLVAVREDREIGVYWRVYVRVAQEAQNGIRGEPLRSVPWDFASRVSGDADTYEVGGQLMETVPSGYYVDFTQLAADYGWLPIPSDRTWRQNFSGVLFWEFVKTDGLAWRAAMRELYTEDALNRFLNNEPVVIPTTVPDEEDEATDIPADEITPTRTPTPIPPDLQ